MNVDHLLRLARETVNAVPTCLAITIDGNGDANARAINTSKRRVSLHAARRFSAT